MGVSFFALAPSELVAVARFGGEGASDADKVNLLLSKLRGVGLEGRAARFRCVIAIASGRKVVGLCEGVCEGIISLEAQGSQGFGYDPIFLFPSLNKTFAELNESEKNQYSHRARAVASLLKLWNGKEPFSFHS